jgi:hypothetical protein
VQKYRAGTAKKATAPAGHVARLESEGLTRLVGSVRDLVQQHHLTHVACVQKKKIQKRRVQISQHFAGGEVVQWYRI